MKPHARVIRDFAAGRPLIAAPSPRARLAVDGESFYADPASLLPDLLEAFRRGPTPR
jgi:hypothetical protein